MFSLSEYVHQCVGVVFAKTSEDLENYLKIYTLIQFFIVQNHKKQRIFHRKICRCKEVIHQAWRYWKKEASALGRCVGYALLKNAES